MDGSQGRAVEAEPFQLAGRGVEDRHVGLRQHLARGSEVTGRLEVEHEAALVAVPGEVPGVPRHAVAARRFDLDHIGPELCQQPARHRPGHALREVEHAHACVGTLSHLALSPPGMAASLRIGGGVATGGAP